jgi:hypothetical protein
MNFKIWLVEKKPIIKKMIKNIDVEYNFFLISSIYGVNLAMNVLTLSTNVLLRRYSDMINIFPPPPVTAGISANKSAPLLPNNISFGV